MRAHPHRVPAAQRGASGAALLSGIVGLAGVIALLTLGLVNEYRDARRYAQVQVENTTRLLEEHALTIVGKGDLLLREARRNLRPEDMREADTVDPARRRQLHLLLKSMTAEVTEIAVLHVTNARGDHIYSSLDPVPPINIADRDHFLRQRDDANAGLVISPPLVSRTTGKWTVVLSRRIESADGRFAGILNAILDLNYFQRFYRTLDLGAHGAISLFDTEFRLAARHPERAGETGKATVMHAKDLFDQGIRQATYSRQSNLDGIVRLYSFRQVDRLPLLVFAGIAEDDYLADSHRHAWQFSAVALVFILVVGAFWLRQRRAEDAVRRLNAELEQRVAQRTAQLEAANAELQEFSYSMSHDMRAPLRALDGFSRILLDEHGARLDDEGRRLLGLVRENAQRMAHLIDDIVLFVGTGRRPMEYSAVDVAELASQCFAALQAAAPQRRMRLALGTLPPAWGDRAMLALAFSNLLSNAVKFTPAGQDVEVEVAARAEGGETVYVVSDHGVGFDMRYAGKLFRVFERVHRTGEYEGNAIGLALVKRVAERHGGRVWAEARVGAGASFFLALPQRQAAARAA